MKKNLSVLLFFLLSTSFVFAESDLSAKQGQDDANYTLLAMNTVGEPPEKNYEDYSKKDDYKMYLYLLATGGFIPYSSTNFDQTGFDLGVTLGGQLTKTFAMEVAYAYSSVYSETLLGTDIGLYYNDIKLNFLYSQHLNITDSMSLVPYFGGGLLYSIGYATVGNLSASNDDFGILLKGGLRYKYKYLFVGVGAEYILRFVEAKTVGINFEAGVIF